MTTLASRRWFRFSLRTLFVGVTLAAIWLGFEVNSIRVRRQAWADNTAAIETLEAAFGNSIDRQRLIEKSVLTHLPSLGQRPPWWRILLGDEAHRVTTLLPYPADDPRTQRMVELFPEAELFTFVP